MIVDTHAHYWQPASPERPHDSAALWAGEPLSAEALLAEMDAAGADKLIQVTPSVMGYDNRYAIEGAAAHADRVRVFCRFDPFGPEIEQRLQACLSQPNVIGIRLTLATPPFSGWLTDGTLDEFWAAAERLDIPVAVYAPDQAPALASAGRRHPGLRLLIDHMALGLHLHGDGVAGPGSAFERWDEVLKLNQVPNIYLKVSGLPEANWERYPFPKSQQRVREVYDTFGPDRMIWGSNFPVAARVCSYQETLDLFRRACDFLAEDAREKILGGAARRVLRLPW